MTLDILDPRPPLEYLRGHVPRAVNVPLSKVYDTHTLELLPNKKLAEVFGEAGVDANEVLLYDSHDGQSAAMVAWVLEYLGHPKVRILSCFFEGWVEQGYQTLYRPVKPRPREFIAKPNHELRAHIQDLIVNKGQRLIDARSKEEYLGQHRTEPRAGHLPAAINLPWTRLVGEGNMFLRTLEELKREVAAISLNTSEPVVTYCSTGPRAAVAFVALQQLRFSNVRVYDGSFHQWASRPDLQVETN